MRTLIFSLVFVLTACRPSKVKVIADKYPDEKPKTIRYFKSKADSREVFTMQYHDGQGTSSKPISFDEEGYYHNGKLEFKGQYVNGKTCGLWEYFYENGIPEARSYYDNKSHPVDTVYCWYESGKKKRELIEIDKKKNLWHAIDYYENGNKHIECYLTMDASDKFNLNGLFKEWYDNSQPKVIATFKNNWTVGLWKEYDIHGKVEEDSGEPHSITFE